jgi:hypothetical protein
MKIRFRKFYILVESAALVRVAALPTGHADKALAAACFPFLFVKDEKSTAPWVINHEAIHLRQQLEFLLVGTIFLWIAEYIYYRIFLRLSAYETYLRHAGEQEAYLNHHNPDYLKNRKFFAMIPYVFHKKKFSNNRQTGEITLLTK